MYRGFQSGGGCVIDRAVQRELTVIVASAAAGAGGDLLAVGQVLLSLC